MARNAVTAELDEPRLTKGERTTLKILDGAIKCYAKSGFDGASFDEIAKAAGVTRPLLNHYFKNKDEIFILAVKRIRLGFQRMAIAAIEKATTPEAQLEAYVGSTFDWIEQFPSHIRVWLLYFYQCSTDKKARAVNSELVHTGHDRITALLEAGVKAGVFAPGREAERAKAIQVQINGALVCAITEDLRFDMKSFRRITGQACLDIARG